MKTWRLRFAVPALWPPCYSALPWRLRQPSQLRLAACYPSWLPLAVPRWQLRRRVPRQPWDCFAFHWSSRERAKCGWCMHQQEPRQARPRHPQHSNSSSSSRQQLQMQRQQAARTAAAAGTAQQLARQSSNCRSPNRSSQTSSSSSHSRGDDPRFQTSTSRRSRRRWVRCGVPA